jgi:Putative peptidoglycan binding domain/OmpA family
LRFLAESAYSSFPELSAPLESFPELRGFLVEGETAPIPSSSGADRTSPEYLSWLQRALNQVLGMHLTVDGRMGPQTRKAVLSFQKREGLPADGIVGPLTERKLQQASGTSLSSFGSVAARAASPLSATCPPARVFVDCPRPGRPFEVLDHFAFDQSGLNRSRHLPQINRVAGAIVTSRSSPRPIRNILIAGHTDSVGSDDYNFLLSRRRAETVVQELCAAIEKLRPGLTRDLNFQIAPCGERQTKTSKELSRRVEVFLRAARIGHGFSLEPHGCPIPRFLPGGTAELQESSAPRGCIASGESCSTSLRPILCLYADVDPQKDPNGIALFRGMADRWACIVGAPHAFFFPAVGGSPFRTGQGILQSITDLSLFFLERKLKEVHIFGHMISDGGCTPSGCTPVVGTGIRGRESNWTGLYLDRIAANRSSGGRTISDISLDPLADDVVFVLHGCNSAAGEHNFARGLFEHLTTGLPQAVVYGHPFSACAGQENCWVEYKAGNKPTGKRISLIPNYGGGHRCCPRAARC